MAFQMHEPEHGKAHDESGGIVVVVTTFQFLFQVHDTKRFACD